MSYRHGSVEIIGNLQQIFFVTLDILYIYVCIAYIGNVSMIVVWLVT